MAHQPRVPVVSMDGTPLMPTTPAHARIMIRDKVARPRRNKLGLFYIQMLIPVGTATQPMALAIDPGARYEGIAVASHRQVEMTAQVNLPDGTHRKMETRRNLRRARRFRKTPRRPKRFANRRHGRRYWLAPTQRSKVQARLKAATELCRIYPVQQIIIENVRHRPEIRKRARFFSTAEIGKTLTRLKLADLAPVTMVEASDTAAFRDLFGLTKIQGPNRPEVFEAQAVDAAAMLVGVTGCALGTPSFHVFTALRFHRRSLHKQNPQKGGIRPIYGGTSNGGGVRKGDWVEARTRKGNLRGWVCGLPTGATPKIGVAGPDGKRIGQFGVRQVRLLARNAGFTWRRGVAAVGLPTVQIRSIQTALKGARSMGDLFDHASAAGGAVPIPVGYDQGNDDTKIVIPESPDGIIRRQDDGSRIASVRSEVFPSRWAPYQGADWGIGGKVLALSIDDGPPFAFGSAASLLPGVREPQSNGQIIEPLLAAALWKSGIGADGKPTSIILGSETPLGVFDQTAAGIQERLQGRTMTIRAGSETRQIIIQEVVMRPQGVATLIYLMGVKQLPQSSGIGLVVDIGGGTTDVVAVDLRTGDPIRDFCFSAPFGMGFVAGQMAAHIEAATGFLPPNHLAREALTNPVFWCQKTVGGSEVAAPILQSLVDRVRDAVTRRLGNALREVSALIPVGGGAAAKLAQSTVGRQLESLAPGTLVAISPKDLPFTNALGGGIAAERAYRRALSAKG